MSLENLLGNCILHILLLLITASNVRFADSADCLNKVIVSAPLIHSKCSNEKLEAYPISKEKNVSTDAIHTVK